jgi:hypothetical protein
MDNNKEGHLLLCQHFPCITNVSSTQTPDFRLQPQPRLVLVVAQLLGNSLLVVPLSSRPAPLSVPISVSNFLLHFVGDHAALPQGRNKQTNT